MIQHVQESRWSIGKKFSLVLPLSPLSLCAVLRQRRQGADLAHLSPKVPGPSRSLVITNIGNGALTDKEGF